MRWMIVPTLALLTMISASVHAGEVHVAVASNFISPLKVIKTRFEKFSGHRMIIISGSTGKLYAQIKHGAPFDLLLAADSLRPRLLEEEGFAVKDSRFTYAVGRLTLWSRDPNQITKAGAEIFQQQTFNHLAMANPKTAPYGRAALQALKKLGVWGQVKDKIVQGENIGQTFLFVATKNAELGFVARLQTRDTKNKFNGSRWDVPPDLYDPIYQDLVLLKRARDKPSAHALAKFLQTPEAQKIIADFGYDLK
ncbi:Molybdenum ABC transporter, substrate-binding protein ModA [hydrothermal vent metagenome]|uniref:Molybdenum ABC transporter, substrate-binding protein ModA n=1 Tax=hydrothermal vent metagenome TaxID=652676 RepID=A0A3B1DA09_9ZZZZ